MLAFQILLALATLTPESRVEQLKRDGAQDIRRPAPAIVQYVTPGKGVTAEYITGGKIIASFNTWYEFQPKDADTFLELRETVEPGVQDLIVRRRNGGTEASSTSVEIFRFRNGALVSVLSVTEQETAMEHPSGDVTVTTTRLEYAPRRITATATKNPGQRQTRTVYEWNEARFRFLEAKLP